MRYVPLWAWALGCPLFLVRCNCDPTLNAIPNPDIEIRDPLSGLTNDDPKTPNNGHTPLTVEFGTLEVGASATRIVELNNLGGAPLKVSSLGFAGPDATDPRCPSPNGSIEFASAGDGQPMEIAKDGQARVTLRYTAAGGAACRALVVVSDDPDESTVKVYFTASGVGPKLCVVGNPTGTVDFGSVHKGATKNKVVRLESCGTRPITLTALGMEAVTTPVYTLVSPTAPPSAALPPCTGINAADCGFDATLRFHPTQRGTFTGTLKATSTSAAGETVYSFGLTGTAATCTLEVLPAAVDFGALASGAHVSQQVMVRNTGGCHCRVDALEDITPASQGFTIVSRPALPWVLEGSLGCDGDPTPASGSTSSVGLTVQYTSPSRPCGAPVTVSTAVFHIQSASNVAAPELTVSLAATQAAERPCGLCTLEVVPASVDFGAVPSGGHVSQQVTVRNTGGCHCRVDGLGDITPANLGFTFVNRPTAPPWVIPGSEGCPGDPTPAAGATSSVSLTLQYAAPAVPCGPSTAPHAVFHIQSASNLAAPDLTVNLRATSSADHACNPCTKYFSVAQAPVSAAYDCCCVNLPASVTYCSQDRCGSTRGTLPAGISAVTAAPAGATAVGVQWGMTSCNRISGWDEDTWNQSTIYAKQCADCSASSPDPLCR